MTDPANPSDGPAASPPVAERTKKGRWQVGLRTLLLLIWAVAAWLGVIMNREKTLVMQSRLNVLRSLARELEVDDPGRIAVVKKLNQWMGEERWDLYLPSGSYRICMATREVGTTGFPPVMKSMPIAPGTHAIAVDQPRVKDSWKGVLTLDGSVQLTIEETKEFSSDSSETSDDISISDQFPSDQPLVLHRCRFSSSPSGGTTGPSNGLMIWIEPDPESRRAR